MDSKEEEKNNDKSNYKPSRFILKKQQALIQQGTFYFFKI